MRNLCQHGEERICCFISPQCWTLLSFLVFQPSHSQIPTFATWLWQDARLPIPTGWDSQWFTLERFFLHRTKIDTTLLARYVSPFAIILSICKLVKSHTIRTKRLELNRCAFVP
ncbi:uncharacterized protein K460DRAFT_132760 [Cucurbitaria berberidis CBS 394.84]|uniref:Uncharacterized protein n=1 Tax=Cucurbitaria berberidis CBS 394.84 TaxID=1168544 RepID=A0A9P4GC71_9PLEO|nr:uncharacterized protein K460DRAFT_132760 [Cucurbitaria berberidis CBS 394.84]KAF1842666.1 hypothetical protein K460DRAFT_132760 [Cucurbitaria berberidis CBS 394.84]